MHNRHRQPFVRYGGNAGFNTGPINQGRVNHVKINNPKPFPVPPPTPCDPRGVRHAQLQEKNIQQKAQAQAAPAPAFQRAKDENERPPEWAGIPPRTKYQPLQPPTKRELLLRSLHHAFLPPEVTPPPADDPSDPLFPGRFVPGVVPAPVKPSKLPDFGTDTAKHYATQLRETRALDADDLRVLEVFEALKIQGQTRERYHENALALDKAVELQPQREKYRALDCAAAAKRERRLAEALEKEEREREERQRQAEEAARRAEEERERRRQEREDANNRRIAEAHRRAQEERIRRNLEREEEQRRVRQQEELWAREQEECTRRAEAAAEARRLAMEEEFRRAKEAEIQQRQKREAELRAAHERLAMQQELSRLRAEREAAVRLAQEQEERMRQAVLEERRAALDALRQATREANEMMAQMERDQAAKDAFVRAAEQRAHLIEQELKAREQQRWAEATAFKEQLERAQREYARLEQAFREAQIRDQFGAQERAEQERLRAYHEDQQRAQQERLRAQYEEQQRAEQAQREAQERAQREAQEQAQREAQERAEREQQEAAARAAHEAEAAAHEAHLAAVARHICDVYDHKWTVLKTRKDIDGQVPYADFPIPWFPYVTHVGGDFPPAPPPAQIALADVRAFVLSPFRASMAGKGARERVRAEMLLWHPDKFQSKFLRLVREEDREIAVEAVGVLSRILTQIKEDVENEEWAAKEAERKAKEAAAGAAAA